MGIQRIKHNLKRQRENVMAGEPGSTPYYPTTTIKVYTSSSSTSSFGSGGVGIGESHGSEKMLFTTIKTTKMKRTNMKPTQTSLALVSGVDRMDYGCGGCGHVDTAENAELVDLAKLKHSAASNKGLKGVSLKAIGVSFASIFKPNKRMTSCNQVVAQSVATSQPGGTVQNDNKSRVISSPNIIIDNAGVYIPQLNGIKISIQKTPMTASTGVIVQPAAQAANNTPKLQSCMKKMNSMGAATVVVNNNTKTTPVITPTMAQMKSMANLATRPLLAKEMSTESDFGTVVRKNQPSMGVTAYSLKSRRNIRDIAEQMVTEQPNNNNNNVTPVSDNGPKRLFKKKSSFIQKEAVENVKEDRGMEVEAQQKVSSPPIYECLSNYQTNHLYYALDGKSTSQSDENSRNETITNRGGDNSSNSSAAKLIPFLDSLGQSRTLQHYVPPPPPPILSSTVRRSIDSNDSEPARLSLSPVSNDDESIECRRHMSSVRAKKMKSFSHIEYSGFSSSQSPTMLSSTTKEKVFYTYV